MSLPPVNAWLFPVDLDASFDAIVELSSKPANTNDVYERLCETLWRRVEDASRLCWIFAHRAGLEDIPTVSIRLVRDLNGEVWGIQAITVAPRGINKGTVRVTPSVPFLFECLQRSHSQSRSELLDAYTKHLETISVVPVGNNDDEKKASETNFSTSDPAEQLKSNGRIVCRLPVMEEGHPWVYVGKLPDLPSDSLTPFEEARNWTKENVFDSFANPLFETVGKPYDVLQIDWEDIEDPSFFGRLEIDEDEAVQHRTSLRQHGTEALGWYQPFHLYGDDYWGIYLRAPAIAVFGRELQELLKRANSGLSREAYLFVTTVVVQHEYFHAQFETYSLMLETILAKSVYRPNGREIYQQQYGTSQCIEEALANFFAWEHLERLLKAIFSRQGVWTDGHADIIRSFFEDLFDMSPPGYRDWRLGHSRKTWRMLANEGRFGVADSLGPLAPLDTQLRDQPATVLPLAEIPIYITDEYNVGEYVFATPKRREVEHVLLARGYKPQPGTGSHTKWLGPTGQHFSLPNKNPLSRLVFRNLLHHFGMTKKDYLQQTGRG